MTDDPNKKHGEQPAQPGRPYQEQTGQNKDKGAENTTDKRPMHGERDEEIDEQNEKDKAGQRRAS